MKSGGIIQINTAGNCELYGKIALADDNGSVELNDGGQINPSDDIDISCSSITASTISPESTDSDTSNPNTAPSTVISSSNVDSGLTFIPNTIEPTTIYFFGDEFNTDGFSIVSNGSNVIEGSVLHLDDAILTPTIKKDTQSLLNGVVCRP